MKAYDIAVLPRSADRGASDCHGWCFGLPPGIRSEQWPLDPNNGYPLMHGFTLLLPDDHRVHGPETVALSFFSTAPDHFDGAPTDGGAEVAALVDHTPGSLALTAPTSPDLLLFWEAARAAHPRLHRMRDVLDCAYAVVLLTREEFDGPFCLPPRLDPCNRVLARTPPPNWLEKGSARAFWDYSYSPHGLLPAEDYHIYRTLGGIPEPGLAVNRGLSWTPRANDPNAGKLPDEPPGCDGTPAETGYINPYYWVDGVLEGENYREHDWAKDHAADHIGGTMRPSQAVPRLSPHYVAFEEYFGGYNFGGGSAQLDFKNMRLEWACG